MTFYIRDFSSEEQYDISKFMDYQDGVYDVVASPFLEQLKQLQTTSYYYVDNGYHDIDLIASAVYGDLFFSYLIQYYNNDFRETFPDGTVLNMFSSEDLKTLYHELAVQQNTVNRESGD